MGVFDFFIDIKQKRWVVAGTVGDSTTYNVRNRVTKLSIVDPGSVEGSVGVQEEMFLNIFPQGVTLKFVDGIMERFANASIKPFSMVYSPETSGKVVISDNFDRISGIESAFLDTVKLELDGIDVDTYSYEGYTPYDASTPAVEGEANYDERFLVAGTGLQLWVEDSVPLTAPKTYNIMDSFKLNLKGSWVAASVEDEGGVPGVVISRAGTNVVFNFKNGWVTYSIPWSSFAAGSWVEIPDPGQYDEEKELSEQVVSGISVSFGFISKTYTEDPMDIFDANVQFNGAFQNVEDSQEDFEESCVFRRVMDIADLKGSLGRYSDLSAFYRAPRLRTNSIGQLVFETLVEPDPEEEEEEDYVYEAEWLPYTGSISTTQTSFFRSSRSGGSFGTLEAADNFAASLINMLKIFKAHYTSFINRKFSTDTDEYPTQEEDFNI